MRQVLVHVDDCTHLAIVPDGAHGHILTDDGKIGVLLLRGPELAQYLGFAEKPGPGIGTQSQVDIAHQALDTVNAPEGPLALRVLAMVGRIHNKKAGT